MWCKRKNLQNLKNSASRASIVYIPNRSLTFFGHLPYIYTEQLAVKCKVEWTRTRLDKESRRILHECITKEQDQNGAYFKSQDYILSSDYTINSEMTDKNIE